MSEGAAIILAAGKGTRMKSSLCKVLHPLAGRPMVVYVVESVLAAGVGNVVAVVGHQSELVEDRLQAYGVRFASQVPQLGTGHAVMSARSALEGFSGDVLILCGDIPLIRTSTIRAVMEFHRASGRGVTVVTAALDDPSGYGRIIRDESGNVSAVVEERDADESVRGIREVNTGVYAVKGALLFNLLSRVGRDNAQREYYLTDIISEAVKAQVGVAGFPVEDSSETMGVNTRADLAAADAVVRAEVRRRLMDEGVTLIDPAAVYPDFGVSVGPDTVIHPGVALAGATSIGRDCVVEPGVFIKDCVVGDGVRILLGSRLEASFVSDGASVGPMAHVRPETRIGARARIGNFVEVKKTIVGEGTKASHLTYLGDSVIGRDVNIGCGTVTCNYDGKRKHATVIEDECFVGSDVKFVAPVRIGRASLIAAGSVITRDVPPKSLAVARSKQKNYPLRGVRSDSSSGAESCESNGSAEDDRSLEANRGI
jgi:bifunctional UDP-N-acetylglucosamine pyrophosphorylase / glucosamine-1-phosphate N-acetyltransferase